MKQIPLYQVDAFTDKQFGGNPAAVCVLDALIPDHLMQNIAAENNLSETAFVLPAHNKERADYDLRWFTPKVEVDLCGHATLASAHILFDECGVDLDPIRFDTKSGVLIVTRSGKGTYEMDFPAWDFAPADHKHDALSNALGQAPQELYCGKYWMAIFKDEDTLARLRPDFRALNAIEGVEAIICSAAGDTVDFVSRFFCPHYGIDEDPVTGSAHCILTPYWAQIFGKTYDLTARQISARGGDLVCSLSMDRVIVRGACTTYLKGEILL